MNKRHIRYLFLVLVVVGFPAHAAFSQIAWSDADCYYNATVVNGYASVSVGYEMGYYYDTSIALVMYDPYNNIVAAQTNYTNGYSHAHDDVDFSPTSSGTYTIRVYVDVQIYYSDYCGWIDYWGFSHVYQPPVTAWDYYELEVGDPEYCWTYCCMSLLELLAEDQVPCPSFSITPVTSVSYPVSVLSPWNGSWGSARVQSTDWVVDINAYLDCSVMRWKAKVTKADSTVEMFYRLLAGVSEATTGAATAANYCKMIGDLSALGNVTGVAWYMVDAVRAHEYVHYNEWQSCLNPEFTTMKSTIESLSVANTSSMTQAQAKTAIKALSAYTSAVNTAFSNAHTVWFSPSYPDPNAQTDAAEHSIVDPRITQLRNLGTANGWPSCPPMPLAGGLGSNGMISVSEGIRIVDPKCGISAFIALGGSSNVASKMSGRSGIGN